MNLKNINTNIYYESIGNVFKIVHIAKSEVEANEYMTNNKECSVIDEDEETGLIFIAENIRSKVK